MRMVATKYVGAIAAAVLTLSSASAGADIYDFVLTSGGAPTAFSIDSDTPSGFIDGAYTEYFTSGGYRLLLTNPTTYDSYGLGNLNLSYNNTPYYGAQLYSGPNSAPVISTGSFGLTTASNAPATLQITRAGAPGAPAPEVGAGLLSILAAAAALVLTRRRKVEHATVSA